MGDEKGEKCRPPETTSKCNPVTGSSWLGWRREGEKAKVAGSSFSWEEQSCRRAAQWQGSKQCQSQQIPDRALDSTMQLSTIRRTVVFQTKKCNNRVLLPLKLPKLASCCPRCWDQDHINFKQRVILVGTLFPSVTNLLKGCLEGNKTEVRNRHYGDSKTNPTTSSAAVLYYGSSGGARLGDHRSKKS